MDDDPEVLRARAAAAIAEVDAMLDQREWERIRRQMAGGQEEPAQRPAPASAWTPPEPEPVQRTRATAPRERPPPTPPVPDKITRIQHDDTGRISATESYSGAGAAAASSWEGWVRSVLKAEIATVYEVVWDTVGTATGEITREERAVTNKIVAELTRRIEELELRLAGSRPEEYRNAAD